MNIKRAYMQHSTRMDTCMNETVSIEGGRINGILTSPTMFSLEEEREAVKYKVDRLLKDEAYLLHNRENYPRQVS